MCIRELTDAALTETLKLTLSVVGVASSHSYGIKTVHVAVEPERLAVLDASSVIGPFASLGTMAVALQLIGVVEVMEGETIVTVPAIFNSPVI